MQFSKGGAFSEQKTLSLATAVFGSHRGWLLAAIFALLGLQSQAQEYAYDVKTVAGGAGITGSKDGMATSARFMNPQGVAFGKNGTIYIADTGNNTIRQGTNGYIATLAGVAGSFGAQDGVGVAARFCSPTSLVTDANGNLYVADAGNNAIRKVTPDGTVTTLAGAAGWFGAVDGTGAAARFYTPKGLAIDTAGNLYVADFGNQLIRKVTPSGVVTTLAGSPGQLGLQDGTGNQAKFSSPSAVAVDVNGNVYVVDSGNRAVRMITPAGAVTTMIGADQDGLKQPVAVGVDLATNLYVADSVNQIIQLIMPSGTITTVAGGITGSQDGFGTASQFNGIGAMSLDSAGNALVADTANQIIRKATLLISPVILSDPQSQTNPAGSAVTLSVKVSGTDPLQYQWYFNSEAITNVNASTLVIPDFQETNVGAYYVIVSNWLAVTSAVANLSLTPAAPVIAGPTEVTAQEGDAFYYPLGPAGSEPMTYSAVGLPVGLVFNSTNGLISGILATNGVFVATLSAQNVYGSYVKTLIFTIKSSVPVITSPLTASGAENGTVRYTITGTYAPTNFGAIGLPLGLSVDATTGRIIGSPAYAGLFTNVTIWAQNQWGTGSTNLQLNISYAPLTGLAIQNVKTLYSSPYLLDFQFSLRDGTNADSHAVVRPVQEMSVQCFENTNPISSTETAVILERGDRKPRKTYLLLDYTASMEFGSTDTNGDGVSDAIDAMQQAAKSLINQQPAEAQFGIYEFHSDDTAPQCVLTMTADKVALCNAIDSILPKYVQGNYAGTRCWDAVFAAMGSFSGTNTDEQHQLVIMTDGYDESSVCATNGVVDEIVSMANSNNVTLQCVSFGPDVNLPVVQQLSAGTGGRFYQALTPADLAVQFGLLGKDMDGQYLLRWASLKRNGEAFQPSFQLTVAGQTASYNMGIIAVPLVVIDTNVPPTNSDGTVNTNYPTMITNPPPVVPDFVATSYTGNVKAGALRLMADAEQGPRTVTLRATYVPRYVRTIRVHYRANYPCTSQLESDGAGEILQGWSLMETNDGAGGKWLQISSSNPTNVLTSIPYGALGNLVNFSFRDLPSGQQAFSLFAVDNTIYTNLIPTGQSFTIATNGFMTNYPATLHGTPIPWLMANGFTTNFNDAELSDPDNDGVQTWMEYLAGTNPRDKNSVLKINSVNRASSYSPYQIQFPTVAGRTYRVDTSSDLQTWNVLQDNIQGSGSVVSVFDTQSSPDGDQFYRIWIY